MIELFGKKLQTLSTFSTVFFISIGIYMVLNRIVAWVKCFDVRILQIAGNNFLKYKKLSNSYLSYLSLSIKTVTREVL